MAFLDKVERILADLKENRHRTAALKTRVGSSTNEAVQDRIVFS
jgi:hypothetical protein